MVIRWTGGKVERWTDGQADRGGRCSGEAFVEDEEVLTNDGEDEGDEAGEGPVVVLPVADGRVGGLGAHHGEAARWPLQIIGIIGL